MSVPMHYRHHIDWKIQFSNERSQASFSACLICDTLCSAEFRNLRDAFPSLAIYHEYLKYTRNMQTSYVAEVQPAQKFGGARCLILGE